MKTLRSHKFVQILKKVYGEYTPKYANALLGIGDVYLDSCDYSECEAFYLEAKRIYKKVLGDNHLDYARSLCCLGTLYSKIHNYSESERYYLESLRITEINLEEHHVDYIQKTSLYASLLGQLGNLYFAKGNYSKSEKYYLDYSRIIKEILGVNHSYYAGSLNNLGDLYLVKGNYSESEHYYLESLRIRKEVLGENHPDYATSLNNLGELYRIQGNYSAAEHYLLESLRIYKEVLGENHPDYATSLNNLGLLYYAQGNFSAAEQYYLESLRIRKEVLGENHPDYAMSLHNLGELYYTQGHYSAAEQYYLKSLRIRKEVLGENHPNYAKSLYALGNLYYEIGNYSEAEGYHIRAMYAREEVLGENHPDYAMSLNDLGCLYNTMALYPLARIYLLKAAKIYETIWGKNHPTYIATLNNLANCYLGVGYYSLAERYYLEVIRLCNLCNEKGSHNYATYLNNLGELYYRLGNYSAAEQYYLESLRTYQEVLGENHPDYAIPLNNLGSLHKRLGNYSEAERYLSESLQITKDLLGEEHSMYATVLDNLGCLYVDSGNYINAERYLMESLRIRKGMFREDHPDYAISLHSLGALYEVMENYSKSEIYYLQSLQIIKEVLGDEHYDYARNLKCLGGLYYVLGNYSKACNYFLEAFNIEKHNFLTSLSYMTEYERALFWETIQDGFEYTYPRLTYRYHFTKPSISTFAYDNELFRKGLLLNSADAVRRSILESGDSVLIEQWNELTEAKQVVMHLEEKEPTSSQLDIYRHRADSLEKQMTISSAAFRQSKEQWNINWERVKKQLSKNEVAIEYFSAPISKDSTMYCALLLRHNSKYPELIPLFEENEVTNITSAVSKSVENSLLYHYTKKGAELTQKVWSSVLSKIKPGETIYFAPTGVLHQLAIEYLPVDSARTMSDVYNMVRLSSTREIVTNKSKESYKSAVVYGGIVYDADGQSLLTESNRYASQDLVVSRGIESDTLNRGTVGYLSGTLEEANHINVLLKENNIAATLYSALRANEESFKSLSGKHNNILHIATHGFTWTDSTARKQDYFADRMKMQLMGDNQPKGPIIDPLNRCGLLFAGANTALQGKSRELPEGVQDGILTAKEISLVDLRDAEVVVLSACETAKGDITSEGVFGLQRAFKMAGVQTIIMSLWKVSDEATQLLMSEFFTNWIAKRQPKREAFKNAQNAVRYAVDEYGDYIYKDKPYYWAGFVMLD